LTGTSAWARWMRPTRGGAASEDEGEAS
jgi:hypothetical protein